MNLWKCKGKGQMLVHSISGPNEFFPKGGNALSHKNNLQCWNFKHNGRCSNCPSQSFRNPTMETLSYK